ncbi:MAG: C4-type zinc ribbon domain-containing protein [Deferrisomatales bacterium]|nr:C4-type zinc ribbon domain-containing protein [Deferrisomatales bacterium]
MAADVLEQLEGLQRVADEIDRLDARRREATEQRDQVAESLSAAQAELGRSEEKAHTIDMERRKRELALKGERDRMARVKSRLGEVKTSREYQAVLTETSSAKQGIADHEEALAKDEQELESITAEVDHIKAKVAGIEEDLAAAERSLAKVAEETDGTVARHRAEESRLLEAMPAAVVDRYRLIRSRRGGLAVVQARDEACTACFMRIPPQMYIEVIRRSKVLQCPNCHRILVPPHPVEVTAEVE